MTSTDSLQKASYAGELFRQFQAAKSMDLIVGLDALVLLNNPVMRSPATQLVAHTENSFLDPKSQKLYVRFSPDLPVEKIVEVQKYIEGNFGFKCEICQWSFPIRLDVSL